jgi:hypothetical protein
MFDIYELTATSAEHTSRRLSNSTGALSDAFVIILVCVIFIATLKFLLSGSEKMKAIMEERIKKALTMRRNKNDPFRTDNGYSWDYIICFRVYTEDDLLTQEQRSFSMKHILARLSAGGMETRLFYSVQHDEVYCKIRAPLQRIMKEADRINYKLLLDSGMLKKTCLTDSSRPWVPVEIPETGNPQTDISPYDYIYCRYEYDEETFTTKTNLKGIYREYHAPTVNSSTVVANGFNDAEVGGSMTTVDGRFFRGVDRLKIMHNIITSNEEGGCGLDTYRLIKDECILGYFPLHDNVELRALEAKWLLFFQLPWNQCTDDVKDYFGEKIGLYFLFLGHYTTWLIPAAFMGFVCWISVAAEDNDPNALLMPYFGSLMAIWGTLMLEFWKRKEKYTAMRWGMIGFEEEEEDRPQFEGTTRRSPVTGHPYTYFAPEERFRRVARSGVTIAGLIVVVICVVTCIFMLRIVMSSTRALQLGSVQLGGIIASVLNALQIQIFNSLYGDYARTLNDYENYRTDTEYEDALIAKTFIFQFVNSFAALFYIAFVKPFIQEFDSCLDSCMSELQVSLGTIFMMQLIVGNFFECAVPSIKLYLAKSENEEGVSKDKADQVTAADGSGTTNLMSEIERNFMMPEYDVVLGTFDDYAELSLQFGFATMFVTAFPLATLLALISNYVELRVDAWKLCQVCRRPEPRSIEDIGTWMTILDIMSNASVFVNSGIIAFTSTVADSQTWVVRVWIFILLSGVLFGVKGLVAFIIPDLPEDVDIQLQRQEYLVNKLLYNLEDDNDEELCKGNAIVPNYVVLEKDLDPL